MDKPPIYLVIFSTEYNFLNEFKTQDIKYL